MMLQTSILLRSLSPTVAARKSLLLPLSLAQALVGQMLSDAYADRSSPTANTRISWSFGLNFLTYANFIHSLFADYCNRPAYAVLVTAKAKGKVLRNYRIKTATLPIFNLYRDMFYVSNGSGGYVKIVPTTIMELMSPITLAHLIMGDGNFDQGRERVRIYTNSFSRSDCLLLASSISNMGIHTSIMEDAIGKGGEQQYILTIGATQLPALRAMVVPHMCPSMLYRVGVVNSDTNPRVY
jgi:hypothetical protein